MITQLDLENLKLSLEIVYANLYGGGDFRPISREFQLSLCNYIHYVLEGGDPKSYKKGNS